MIVQNHDGIYLYQFPLLSAQKQIIHAITSRIAEKEGNIFSMSLKDPYGVSNREKVCKILSLPLENMVVSRQVHGKHVAVVSIKDRGRGALTYDTALPASDAMITNAIETPIMSLSGDCPIVGFFDPVKKAIGLAHAGWRGTVLEIASHTVHVMQKEFGCRPQDILAGIAPSIGPCCYQVREEVLDKVKTLSWGKKTIQIRDNAYYLDLWQANTEQLLCAGLKAENIESSQICTACHPDRFFSYRMEGVNSGRCAFILSLVMPGEK